MNRAATLAISLFVIIAASACGDDDSGGTGGTGGAGVTPGLWVGSFDGTGNVSWSLCLYVNDAGNALQAAESCSLDQGAPFSLELDVVNAGMTPSDEACSFDVRTSQSIEIGGDGSFSFTNDDGVMTVELQGVFDGDTVSGTARASNVPVIESCSLNAWSAMPVDD